MNKCAENRQAELNNSRESIDDDDCSNDEEVVHNGEGESNESYDSEELLEKGTTEAMAIRDSGELIKPERESLVNMGENLTRDNLKELRKMKKEIVDPKIEINTNNLQPNDLLPRIEESKTAIGGRYAQLDESEELTASVGLLADSNVQSARQKLVQATQLEPHRLSEQMLAGQSNNIKIRERRVSNLSISGLINTETLKSAANKGQTKKEQESTAIG